MRKCENCGKRRVLAADRHRVTELPVCVSTRTGRQPKELNACLREYTHRQAKDEKSQKDAKSIKIMVNG